MNKTSGILSALFPNSVTSHAMFISNSVAKDTEEWVQIKYVLVSIICF